MRKLIVLAFLSLDGVMQAPGGPEEDDSGAFAYGGWSVPFWDGYLEERMSEQMGHPFHLLLGRRTYDIFHEAWPRMDPANPINDCVKYVVTSGRLPDETPIWKNSVKVDGRGDLAAQMKKIKEEEGPEIQVHGSSSLVHFLLSRGLADELWLKIYPVTLGSGKRFFGEGTAPGTYELVSCGHSPSGVIVANYRRNGSVRIGSFAS